MSEVPIINFDELLKPISESAPAGEDLSFGAEFDEIKEARREDDHSLPQGDWQTKLKVAEWPKVRDLCVQVLTDKSKDLQVACWLAEALLHLNGFRGLSFGFQLLARLAAEYWPSLYPEMIDGEVALRVGRLDSLDHVLPEIIRNKPLTSGPGYGWVKWQESREVENLGRKEAKLMQDAIAEGKISGEMWDKAVIGTANEFYSQLLDEVAVTKAEYFTLKTTLGDFMGEEAPTLAAVDAALRDCADLVEEIAEVKGIRPVAPPSDAAPSAAPQEQQASSGQAPVTGPSGPPQTREDALRRLLEVAQYFRAAEPHSPVSFLVEKAVRWEKMPLDQWLEDVVKDAGVLEGLREALGVQKPEQE